MSGLLHGSKTVEPGHRTSAFAANRFRPRTVRNRWHRGRPSFLSSRSGGRARGPVGIRDIVVQRTGCVHHHAPSVRGRTLTDSITIWSTSRYMKIFLALEPTSRSVSGAGFGFMAASGRPVRRSRLTAERARRRHRNPRTSKPDTTEKINRRSGEFLCRSRIFPRQSGFLGAISGDGPA